MIRLEFHLEGMEWLILKLTTEPERLKRAAMKGVTRTAMQIMALSQEIVPRKTGVLAGSGTVLPVEFDGQNVTCEMGYGGAASAYAERVHEDLLMSHAPGKTAKYLERPFLEEGPKLLEHIAEALSEEP